MSELLSREEFDREMIRNKFIIEDGKVVCDLCRSDCGQCGAGGWMWRCQEYVNAHPEIARIIPDLKLKHWFLIFLCIMALVFAIDWIVMK